MGSVFQLGAWEITPDGVGRKTLFCLIGDLFVGFAQRRLTAWGRKTSFCLIGYLFVGSAHTRQKLSFWTSSFLKKKVRKIYERYRSACCGRGLGRE